MTRIPAPAHRGGGPSGAEMLRQLRRQARLTQEELAAAADLHVRTIRGLESGRTARPHRVSVTLMARALELDAVTELRFLHAWGMHDRRRGGLIAADGGWGDTPCRLADSSRSWQLLALRERIYVDARHFVVRRETYEVVQALADGLGTRCVMFDLLDDPVALDDVRVAATENCDVGSISADVANRRLLVGFDLEHRHSIGDVHTLAYRLELVASDRPYVGSRPAPPSSGMELGGFVHAPASFVVQLVYEGDATPRSVHQVFQAAPGCPVETVREICPSSCNEVTLALTNPTPGGHGLAWRWG